MDRPEEGYYLGALLLNLVAAELVLAGAGLAVVLGTWPAVPWAALMYGGAALMIVTPIVFYPFTKLVWLAVDLRLQPRLDSTIGSREPGAGPTP